MANKSAIAKLRDLIEPPVPAKLAKLLDDVEFSVNRWAWAANRIKYSYTHPKYLGDKTRLEEKTAKIMTSLVNGRLPLSEAARIIADYRLLKEETGEKYVKA